MDLLAGMTTFVRVVEAGSLSAAAKQLRISTAAVSRHITALEEEVSAQLLSRTTRRVIVTAAGQQFYERALRVLREVDDARAIGKSGGLKGTLRVSLPVTVGSLAGEAIVRAVLAKNPDLRLEVRFEDRIIDLVLEDVDVAVRVAAKPPLSTELVARPISRWTRYLVAAPAYLRKHGEPKTPAALTSHDAIASVRAAATEMWTLEDGRTTERVRVNVRCSCNAGHLVRAMVRQGLGIGLLPAFFVASDIRDRKLRRVLPTWESDPVEAYALYRATHRNEPQVRRLVEELQRLWPEVEREQD